MKICVGTMVGRLQRIFSKFGSEQNWKHIYWNKHRFLRISWDLSFSPITLINHVKLLFLISCPPKDCSSCHGTSWTVEIRWKLKGQHKKRKMMIMNCRKHLVRIFRGLQREEEQRRRSAEENFQQNAEISATLIPFKIIEHPTLILSTWTCMVQYCRHRE